MTISGAYIHDALSGVGMSAMHVTVKRYGGIMAMKPKSRSFAHGDLDQATIDALRTLMASPHHGGAGRRAPDAFTYAFELTDDSGEPREVALAGPDVPDSLRKLLP